MPNPNHPQPGSRIKVEPIRKQADIAYIKSMLVDQPRNLALFTLGINTNLRASDLVRITVNQVDAVAPGESFEIREQKTGKNRRITLNPKTFNVIQPLIDAALNPADPLLKSKKGGALTVSSVNRLVKSWCKAAGLRGNYGSHTLRKTWGYHAWKAGIDLPRLMVIFNHSSQKQTLEYLCIQESQIQEVYLRVEL